jgi:hypothetical protein
MTGHPVTDHTKIVNNLGKLVASALVFLLFPTPRWWGADALLGPLGVGNAGAVRMHAAARCLAPIGVMPHGTHYAIVRVCNLGDGSATWTSVFLLLGSGDCWRGLLPGGSGGGGRTLHDGHGHGNDNKRESRREVCHVGSWPSLEQPPLRRS